MSEFYQWQHTRVPTMVTGEIDCGLIVKFIDSVDDIDNNQKGILWFCSKPRKVAECVLLNRTEHTDRNHRLQSGKKAKYLLSLSSFFLLFFFFFLLWNRECFAAATIVSILVHVHYIQQLPQLFLCCWIVCTRAHSRVLVIRVVCTQICHVINKRIAAAVQNVINSKCELLWQINSPQKKKTYCS